MCFSRVHLRDLLFKIVGIPDCTFQANAPSHDQVFVTTLQMSAAVALRFAIEHGDA